jgi:hypothetical protein
MLTPAIKNCLGRSSIRSSGPLFILLGFIGAMILLKLISLKGNTLFADDLSYLVFGLNLTWHGAFHVNWVVLFQKLFGSVLVTRLLIISMAAMGAYFHSKTIYRLTESHIKTFFIVLIPFLHPAFLEQVNFITGSWGIIAVSLFLAALYLQFEAIFYSKVTIFKIALISILYFLVTFTAPMFYMVLIIPFVLCWFAPQKKAAAALAAVTAILILGGFASRGSYHYASIPGWVNYDLPSLLRQAGYLFSLAWKLTNIFGLALLVILLATAIYFFLKTGRGTIRREQMAFIAVCVVGAVLTTGPPLVTIFSLPRYLVCSIFFVLTGLLFVGALYNNIKFYSVSGLIISILFFQSQLGWQHEYFDGQILFQNKLEKLISDEAHRWKGRDAQLILLLDAMPRYGPGGYNHWTTGLVRFISQNDSLIAISGTKGDAKIDPFVEKWRIHGEEYWGVREQKGRKTGYRIRFKGLEESRTTFVYHFDAKFDYRPMKAVCVKKRDSIRMAPFGDVFSEVSAPECVDDDDHLVFAAPESNA